MTQEQSSLGAADPLLTVSALPVLPAGDEIKPADEWAQHTLREPETGSQPGFGKGTWGIKAIRGEYGEVLRPRPEGLVRELPGRLVLPRITLDRNGYMELQGSRLLDPDVDEAVRKVLHPAFLVSYIWGFFGIACGVWQHYNAGPNVDIALTLKNVEGTNLWSDWPMLGPHGEPTHEHTRPYQNEGSDFFVSHNGAKRDSSPVELTDLLLERIYIAYGFFKAPEFRNW